MIVSNAVFRWRCGTLCKQLPNLGQVPVTHRAVMISPALAAWRGRPYTEIAAHSGQIRFAGTPKSARGGSHAHVAGVCAKPVERFAIVVVQYADELVHIGLTCINTHTVNIYSVYPEGRVLSSGRVIVERCISCPALYRVIAIS